MLSKKLLVLALLLSANLGVDAKRSARKTEKLYRKSGKFVKKLRNVWQRLGVKPFIVKPGKVGEPCMLKSEVEADYLRKSTVSRDYVRKSEVVCAGVVVEGDVGGGGGVDEKKESLSPRKTAKLYRKAGKFQRKLRSAWALLGVRPYLVQPGEDGDECVLTSKVEADYVLKTTVDAEYVLKSAAEVCEDCDGVPNGPNKGDCSGDCFGTKENDACGVCDGDGSFCANSPEAAAALGAIVEVVGTAEAASKFFAEMIDGLAEDAVTAVKPPTTKDDGSVVVGFTLKPDADNFKDGDCTDDFKAEMKEAVRGIMTGVGTDAVLVVTCDAAARRRRRMKEIFDPEPTPEPLPFDVDVVVKQPTASTTTDCEGVENGKKTYDCLGECGGDAREGPRCQASRTDPPVTNPPATDPPVTDPPATDPPATDPPVTDPPVTSCEYPCAPCTGLEDDAKAQCDDQCKYESCYYECMGSSSSCTGSLTSFEEQASCCSEWANNQPGKCIPPGCKPVAVAIDENSGAGQIVYTGVADEPGFWSLGGADAGAFSIDLQTGEVTMMVNPDHEQQSEYLFTVVATNAAGDSSEQAVTLTINNLDEEP